MVPPERATQSNKPTPVHLSQRSLLAAKGHQEGGGPKEIEGGRKQRGQKLRRSKRRRLQRQEGRGQKTLNAAASPQKLATRRRVTVKGKTMREG